MSMKSLEELSDSDDEHEIIVFDEPIIGNNDKELMFITGSTFICFLNIWAVFSSILWFTIIGIPTDILLLFELIVELLLFFEVIIRIFVKKFSPDNETFSFIHTRKNDPWWRYIALLVISIPQYTIIYLARNFSYFDIEDPIITIGLPIRILRVFEITRYIEKTEELLFFKYVRGFIFFRLLVNFGNIILLTHISAASWLLIQKYATDETYNINSTNELNPFRDGLSYFSRTNKQNAPATEQYIDSLQWVVTAVCGCSFGDVTPRIIPEIIASLVVMILGASLLAKLFGDFASLNYLLQKEKSEEKNKYSQALNFCRMNKIKKSIKAKVHTYYKMNDGIISAINFQDVWNSTPNCLHTEMILLMNKDFISQCRLFENCSSDFLISFMKHLKPTVCLLGDIIIQNGELSHDIYFIKDGKVEILDLDDQSRINTLGKGEFFGETGYLVQQTKFQTVRALKNCHLLVLSRKDFEKLSDMYPEEFEYFKILANKRVKKSHSIQQLVKKENQIIYDKAIEKENLEGSISNSKRELLNIRDSKSNPKHSSKKKTKSFNTKKFLIYPLSKSYYIWTYFMGIAICYNFFYVSYSLTFEYEAITQSFAVVDIFSVLIYITDIIIHTRIPIRTINGFNTNFKAIFINYYKTYLILDLISTVPFDYIFNALVVSNYYKQWIRILRLIKIKKFMAIIDDIMEDMDNKRQILKVFILIIIFIFMNHYAACGMYVISYATEINGINVQGLNFFRRYDQSSIIDQPMIELEHWAKYVNYLYWSYQASSSGATGDVIAVTTIEKLFQIFVMLAFRVYLAFLTAEVSILVASYRSTYSGNNEKVQMYDEWMKHIKLSNDKILRVKKYCEYKWQKFKGLDENEILSNLPETLKLEILENMLSDIIENSELFPKSNPGFLTTLLKKFTFAILTDGEYVFKKGEVSEEVFFLIEGKAAVLDEDEETILIALNKNDIFGEMGIVNNVAGIRTKSVKAISPLSLAILHIQEFNELCKKFPSINNKLKNKVKEINKYNEALKLIKDNFYESVNLDDIQNIANKKTILENKKSSLANDIYKSGMNIKDDISKNEMELDSIHPPTEKIISFNENKINEKQFPDSNDQIEKEIAKPLSKYHQLLQIPQPKMPEETPNILDLSDIALTQHCKDEEDETFPKYAVTSPKDENIKRTNSDQGNNSNNKLRINNDFQSKLKLKSTVITKKKTIKQKLNIIFEDSKKIILTLVAIFNYGFIPIKITIASISYNAPLIFIEIVCIIALSYEFSTNLYTYIKNRKSPKLLASGIYDADTSKKPGASYNFIEENEEFFASSFKIKDTDNYKPSIICLIKDAIAIIPLALIFDYYIDPYIRIHSIGYSFLQLNRLLIGEMLYFIFRIKIFKKNIALRNFLAILYTYFIMNHLAACGWIMTANLSNEDMNYTWLSKVPPIYFQWPELRSSTNIEDYASPQNIYLTALYWSYFNSSHIGGDINAINMAEKIYSAGFILIALIFFVILFGDLVSLMDELRPKFQITFEKNYYIVLQYLKLNNLQSFVEKAKKYYDYLWASSKGINEEEILNSLPHYLRFEIQNEHYREAINMCSFFKDINSTINYSIATFYFKKCTYEVYMKDETIISAGSLSDKIYLLLEGQAEKRISKKKKDNHKGIKLPLEKGAVFGGIISIWKQSHNIVATKISKLAVLDAENYNLLCQAYPEWAIRKKFNVKAFRLLTHYARVWKLAKERDSKKPKQEPCLRNSMLPRTQLRRKRLPGVRIQTEPSESKLFTAQSKIQGLTIKAKDNMHDENTRAIFNFSALVEQGKNHQIRSRKKKYYLRHNSKAKISTELLHLSLIIYSGIALPIIIGFKMEFNAFTTTMEIICLIESIFYFISQFFTARYDNGMLTLERKFLYIYFLQHGLILELICMIPFNLFFYTLVETHSNWNYLIDLLRILRVLLLLRIVDILNTVMAKYPRVISFINLFKPWLLFIFVSHISACLWIWFNMMEKYNNFDLYWYQFLEMENRPTSQIYIFGLFFVMNIVTTTGFPEMLLPNIYERAFFIFYVYVGDALFALAFGLIVASSKALPEKYENVYDIISKIDIIAHENQISERVQNKLQEFYAFLVYRGNNTNSLVELNGLIPENMLKSIVINNLSNIHTCLLFENATSLNFLQDLVAILNQRVYLTDDYLTQTGDKDHHLFFIHEGSVNILSKKKQNIVKTLKNGDYFGVMSIFLSTIRKNSVASINSCVVFVLSKKHINYLMDKYPASELKIRTNAYRIALSYGIEKKIAETILQSGNMDPLTETQIHELDNNIPKIKLFNVDEIIDENIMQSAKNQLETSKAQHQAILTSKMKSPIKSEYKEQDYLLESGYIESDNKFETHSQSRNNIIDKYQRNLHKNKALLDHTRQKQLSKASSGIKIKWGVNLI